MSIPDTDLNTNREYGLEEATGLAMMRANEALHDRPGVKGISFDPLDARDIDDTFWIEETSYGFQLIISIADVSCAVDPLIENYAYKKAFTVYTESENNYMLPELLAGNTLSLLEGEDRPAVTLMIPLSHAMEVGDIQILRTCIQNQAKLSYEEADFAMLNPESEYQKMLTTGYSIASELYKKRIANGAIDTNAQVPIAFGTNREKNGMRNTVTLKSQLITQEFMILVNTLVAEMLSEAGVSALYRNQGKVREQIATETVPETEDDKGKSVRAHYSTKPSGHHRMGLNAYLQITSPLRRFGDLVNHKILMGLIENKGLQYTASQLDKIADHLNEVERQMKQQYKQKTLQPSREAYQKALYRHLFVSPQENVMKALDKTFFHEALVMCAQYKSIPAILIQEATRRLQSSSMSRNDFFTILFALESLNENVYSLKEACIFAIYSRHDLIPKLFDLGSKSGWKEVTNSFKTADSQYIAETTVTTGTGSTFTGTGKANEKTKAEVLASIQVIAQIAGIEINDDKRPQLRIRTTRRNAGRGENAPTENAMREMNKLATEQKLQLPRHKIIPRKDGSNTVGVISWWIVANKLYTVRVRGSNEKTACNLAAADLYTHVGEAVKLGKTPAQREIDPDKLLLQLGHLGVIKDLEQLCTKTNAGYRVTYYANIDGQVQTAVVEDKMEKKAKRRAAIKLLCKL